MDINFNEKQYEALVTDANEILFGGSKGGGKSFLIRYAAMLYALYVPGIQIYLFRRKYNDLIKNHMKGPHSFPNILKPYIEAKICSINMSSYEISFKNDSSIFLVHCQHEKDVENYRGTEMHVLLIDESTHFSRYAIDFLRTNVRLGSYKIDYPEVQKSLPFVKEGYFPRIYYATNPGGPSHNYFRKNFVKYGPEGKVYRADKLQGGMKRVFVRSRVYDNYHSLENDPDYIDRLMGLGSANDRKMMIDGDWDAVGGGSFDDVWDEDFQVIPDFEVPRNWIVYRAMDWGSSKPYAIGWFTECNGETITFPDGTSKTFAAGSVIMVNELYGCSGEPNVGTLETYREVGADIRNFEDVFFPGRDVWEGPGDTQIFDTGNGHVYTGHDELVFGYNGITDNDDPETKNVKFKYSDLFTRANKGPGSRKKGFEIMRSMLKASLTPEKNEKGLYFTESCRYVRETLPVLPRSDKDPDDIDTDAEDHLADVIKYFLMEKPVEFSQTKLLGL